MPRVLTTVANVWLIAKILDDLDLKMSCALSATLGTLLSWNMTTSESVQRHLHKSYPWMLKYYYQQVLAQFSIFSVPYN